jgi:spore coat protein U-like protein
MQRHFRIRKIRAIILIITVIVIATISCAADSNVVSVTAVVLSDNFCTFRTHSATLNFGNLDPANPVDRTVSTSIQFRCGGVDRRATYFISDNDGLYATGPNAPRMRHTTTTTEYLPYQLNYLESGTVPRRVWETLTISGTVRGVDYQDAAVGSYRDTVTVSIEP